MEDSRSERKKIGARSAQKKEGQRVGVSSSSGVRVTIRGASGLRLCAPEHEPHGAMHTMMLPFDGMIEASLARVLLQRLHGQVVCGVAIAVEVAPRVKKGAPIREQVSQKVRRRRLFSRWEQGIEVDEVGLFSATSEALARGVVHGARGVVVDATCGVGSLAIAAARLPDVARVIACDIDRGRLGMAQRNARIYQVANKIDFRAVDARQILEHEINADVFLVDPPWTQVPDAEPTESESFPLAPFIERAREVRIKLPKHVALADARKLGAELFLSANWVPKFVLWKTSR